MPDNIDEREKKIYEELEKINAYDPRGKFSKYMK